MKILLLIITLIFVSCTKQKPFLDKRLKTYKYPYKTKIFNYLSQSQKLSMDYMPLEQKGVKYSGNKTIILLHDINTVGAQWKNLADLFFAKGYRVLIPDLIGVGRSLKPEGYQYSLASYAYMLNKFIGWYQTSRPILIGSGFGSDIIEKFTQMYPNNFAKSFLINPTFFIKPSVTTEYNSIDDLYELELKKTVPAIETFIKKKVSQDGTDQEALIWLHSGQRQGIDWRELAFTRAKILHAYMYTNATKNTLADNVSIFYGENATYWPASHMKEQINYTQVLKEKYKQSIKIEGASFYPEITNAKEVFEKILQQF